MGDMDSNPFADPENPFSDPSVARVTSQPQTQPGLDDYNPFEENGSSSRTTTAPQQTVPTSFPTQLSGAATRPSDVPPPAYTTSPAQRLDATEFQRRQEELERKEAELARKEAELRHQQQGIRKDNWPPLPEKCCVKPCFYQDFNVDIPVEFQKIVKLVYYLWMVYAGTLVWNFLTALAMLVTGQDGVRFGMGILYVAVFTPCSFLCWYRPLYKAFRSDSSFNFFLFFFVFAVQFVVSVSQAIGYGACGWIAMGWKIAPVGVNIMVTVSAILFSFIAAAVAFLFVKVQRLYRATGASWQKAQQEFATGVYRNPEVQSAAGNIAAGMASSEFSGGGGGGNRY